jgi:hypothetical protein
MQEMTTPSHWHMCCAALDPQGVSMRRALRKNSRREMAAMPQPYHCARGIEFAFSIALHGGFTSWLYKADLNGRRKDSDCQTIQNSQFCMRGLE